jgi:hypothetical protein
MWQSIGIFAASSDVILSSVVMVFVVDVNIVLLASKLVGTQS